MTSLSRFGSTFQGLITEMDKVVIGYADVKKLSIAALFSGQHVLLEGLPGTAKSLFVEVFQSAVRDSQSVRIQMTADLKPMDIIGVKIYNPGVMKFEIEYGPIVGKHFILLDEINRAPGKTLSAVLSAMQELCVYIAGQRLAQPDPSFFMATQNPVEQEGVYPLPEAALDRFGCKIVVPYASAEEERRIQKNKALDGRDPQKVIVPVVSVEEIAAMRDGIKEEIYLSDAAIDYYIALVRATRPGFSEHKRVADNDSKFAKQIEIGSSVRAQNAIRDFSRVLAAVNGRAYVLPEDIQEVAVHVLRHRIIQTFEATAEGFTTDEAAAAILKYTPFTTGQDSYKPSASR